MSELVEKVARALANREGFRDPSPYRKPAQAAIAAVFDWMAERNSEELAGAALKGAELEDEVYHLCDFADYNSAMLAHLRREALG